MQRRFFLKVAAVAALIPAIVRSARAANSSDSAQAGAASNKGGSIPRRPLGSTGEQVSMVGIGGHHIGRAAVEEAEAIKIIRTALDNGINFLDNCWDYNNGESELRMGKALRDGYREKAFLMTKIDGRDKATAAQQIDESLKRLQTDRLDLLQFHEVIRMNDPDRIFAPGGAIEAAVEARTAGKVRFIGFTGHKSPDIHLHMLKLADEHSFRFDTVQMPLNVMDAHFNSFEKNVVPVLVEKKIGVLGMKSLGDGNILRSGVVTPIECLHYAMNLPTSVVITGCDSMKILEQAIEAARTFQPLSDSTRQALLDRTAEMAKAGTLELYKTSPSFDSTAAHPEWLG
jgi:predicted aldo/keto reductase-like oxidoreductase